MAESSIASQEKPDVVAAENPVQDSEKATPPLEYTPEELNKVIWKLDLFLMPICFVLYTFSVLDVSSIVSRHALSMEAQANASFS